MVFSSPIFLFLFLPLILALYQCFRGVWAKNFLLFVVSFLFYAWGEPIFVFLMLASSVVNYFFGLWVGGEEEPKRRKFLIGLAIAVNLLVLAFYKYANFFVENLNLMLGGLGWAQLKNPEITLPIGISFFTFHALSYVIDIYRKDTPVDKNPLTVALYIFFFPPLVAGPIVRYADIAKELVHRVVTRDCFVEGIRRFIAGLAKKMIIANVVAIPCDQIFALPASELTTTLAWFGILCYTLQIYFDFSGYSDMAIGLARMFGFHLLENFNYPYFSQSIKEFWRRWHISLSSWFRDYLYIPLGGNRRTPARNYFNLMTVFFLCGLWHGASWNFVIWGLFHGAFLVIERTRFGTFVDGLPRPLRHFYAMAIVMVGWVFFRAETFPEAKVFLSAMAGLSTATAGQALERYLSNQVICSVILGVIFSTPIWPYLKEVAARLTLRLPAPVQPITQGVGITVESLILIALLLISSAWLAAGTYNPFIYFRF